MSIPGSCPGSRSQNHENTILCPKCKGWGPKPGQKVPFSGPKISFYMAKPKQTRKFRKFWGRSGKNFQKPEKVKNGKNRSAKMKEKSTKITIPGVGTGVGVPKPSKFNFLPKTQGFGFKTRSKCQNLGPEIWVLWANNKDGPYFVPKSGKLGARGKSRNLNSLPKTQGLTPKFDPKPPKNGPNSTKNGSFSSWASQF